MAIDFTQSNGQPTEPTSLHYLDGHRVVENAYTMCIRTIGQIFEDYDPGMPKLLLLENYMYY